MLRIVVEKQEEKEEKERNSGRSDCVAGLFCSKSGGLGSYCREVEEAKKKKKDGGDMTTGTNQQKGGKSRPYSLQQDLSFPHLHFNS